MNEKVGYIYILTNESYNKVDCVKIGYAEDVEKRRKELYNSSVYKPFEIYATYEIPKIEGSMPDKTLHKLIHALNPDLRLSDNREFFEIYPWTAYEILEALAKIHNREDKLYKNPNNKFASHIIDTNECDENTIDQLYPENSDVRQLFDRLNSSILNIDKDLIVKATRNYVTYRIDGIKKGGNILSLWPKSNSIEVVINLKRGELDDPNELTYDISNRLWSAAQYALKFDDSSDMSVVMDLIIKAYRIKNSK